MNTKSAVQVDTGDIILALEGLAKRRGDPSSPEEARAAVEFCNNLILYPRICYDGNVQEEQKKTLESLADRACENIEDAGTKDLFVGKFRPLVFDPKTEAAIVRRSGEDAGKFSFALRDLVTYFDKHQTTNPVYQGNPFTFLDKFLAFLGSPDPPDGAKIEFFLQDRSIKGGRFFWALLHSGKAYQPAREYLCEHSDEQIARLKALFTRFRYCFALNEGECALSENEEFSGGLYYHPTPYRQRFMKAFTEKIGFRYSSWKASIEPELAQEHYNGCTAYWDDATGGVVCEQKSYIPLLVNRVLTSLKDERRTRTNFLRECLELSQDKMVSQMWDALETYDHMPQSEQEECLKIMRRHTRVQSNPVSSFQRVIEGTLRTVPDKGIKDALRSAVVDFLSEKAYAASVLGQVTDGLFESLEASAAIREIFNLRA